MMNLYTVKTENGVKKLEDTTTEERNKILEGHNSDIIKIKGMIRSLEAMKEAHRESNNSVLLNWTVNAIIALRDLEAANMAATRDITVFNIDRNIENQQKLKEQLLKG